MTFTPRNEPSDKEHDKNHLSVCSVCGAPYITDPCEVCEENSLQFLETDPTTNEETQDDNNNTHL